MIAAASLTPVVTGCEEDENLGEPRIDIENSEISFEKTASTQTVEFISTRDWTATVEDGVEWVSVEPKRGVASSDPVKVKVTVLDNDGYDRECTITLDASSLIKKTLTVKQAGSGKIEGVIGGIAAGKAGESVSVENVLVTGVTTRSFVVTDPTGSILVFLNSQPSVKVGDKVDVKGTTDSHNGQIQIASPTVSKVSSGNSVTYPSPVEINESNISTYSSSTADSKVEYVSFKGNVKKNGSYYNIYIGSYDAKDLSLSYYPGDMDALVDTEIAVEGWYVGGGTHYQVVAVKVNGNKIISADGSADSGDQEEAKEMTISEALASAAGVKAIVTGTVAATYKRGFIITDGTDYLLVYDGEKCAAAEKDKVKVTGTTAAYGGLMQLSAPEVSVLSSGEALTLPEPKALSAAEFDAWSSTKIEYISYEGTLAVSGNYYNVNVAGASKNVGSLYINDSFGASSYNGKQVKVTGFFVGISSSKYINTMVTKLEESASPYLSVSSTAISALADAVSATFSISSNVAWTVTSGNAAYTVSPASGSGDATVTVNFAANTSDADVTVSLIVSTTAEVATKSHTVTLTHKGKISSSVDYSSNVTWKLGDNAYDKTSGGTNAQTGTVNDVKVDNMLKLGTSSKAGKATLTLPAGTKKLSFYAVAWKGTSATIVATVDSKEIKTWDVAGNTGATGSPKYTMTVADSDKYSYSFDTALAADTEVEITTSKAARVILFAINAEK